jgi:hypothetical protein
MTMFLSSDIDPMLRGNVPVISLEYSINSSSFLAEPIVDGTLPWR